MQLTSSDFQPEGLLPSGCAGDGDNISPHLRIVDVKPDAETLVIIMEDLDAPGDVPFTHWVLYDLPATTTELAAGSPPPPGKAGKNDFGDTGYGGPCPPKGTTHRYMFTLYALDTMLALPDGATKQDVQNAMDGFVIGTARLAGTYTKGG